MIDLRQELVQKLCAWARELLVRSKKQNPRRTFQLREYAAWSKDMPWQPRVPQLAPEDLELLHWLRWELSNELGPVVTITDADIVYLALQQLQLALHSAEREDAILRLRFYLMARENRA